MDARNETFAPTRPRADTGTPSLAERRERAIDWLLVRRRARLILGALSQPEDRDDLDDLAQEACVRFLRAIRLEAHHNPGGLLTVVVKRTWVDYLRRKTRARRGLRAAAEDATHAPPPVPGPVDDVGATDRLQRIVEAVLEAHGAGDDVPLLRAYLGGRDWLVVSRELGTGYASVRKRWSRTLAKLRRIVAEDPGLAERLTASYTLPIVSHSR